MSKDIQVITLLATVLAIGLFGGLLVTSGFWQQFILWAIVAIVGVAASLILILFIDFLYFVKTNEYFIFKK